MWLLFLYLQKASGVIYYGQKPIRCKGGYNMAATFSQLAILFLFLSLGVVLGRIKHISVEKSNLLLILFEL